MAKSKIEKVREYFRKHPDVKPAVAAEKFETHYQTAYKARKDVEQETVGEESPLETTPDEVIATNNDDNKDWVYDFKIIGVTSADFMEIFHGLTDLCDYRPARMNAVKIERRIADGTDISSLTVKNE